MKKQYKISIIGAGNVATHLARTVLQQPQIELLQMYNRNVQKLNEFLSATEIIDDLSLLKPVDVLIIAIADDAIHSFSKKIPTIDFLIVHTSGSVSINDLQVDRKGVFYPFQSFSKAKKQIDFTDIPILIEAENQNDIELLSNLASILSKNVQYADSKQRQALHIGGVFVANFTNHLYLQAENILKDNNLSFDLLKPLIQEVAQKILTLSSKQAQTGPAIRGDKRIIDKHLKMLNAHQKEIYELLTKSIQQTKINTEK